MNLQTLQLNQIGNYLQK